MTLDELILSIEVEQEQATKKRDRAIAEVKTILAKARNDGRANLTPEEDADVKAAFARRNQAKQDLVGIASKMANARMAKDAEDEAEMGLAERSADPVTTNGAKPKYDRVARVGQEERTYHPGNSRNGGAFLRDVVRQWTSRDLEAEQRLLRHMQEERVERGQYLTRAAGDAGTGAFTGLVVPQYLTELYAPKVAAMRPLADIANKHDLPADGMTVNISQITTGSSVDLQAAEFDPVAGVSMDDTLLTENIQTAGGYQDLSRQAIDRGTGIEDVTMDDLFRRYASRIDFTLINQAVTGLSAVSQLNTYTAAPGTFAGLYPKFGQAQSAAESAYLGFATPGFAVMHPRRWHWLNSQMISTWPAMAQPGVPTQNAGVNLVQEYGKGARGILPNGLVVIVDANVPTNVATDQDEIYIVAAEEIHLWEDPNAPTFIRAEQPRAKNMAVTLVLYGYFAYSMRRYANGMQKIGGTGLAAPTF
ncbi:hypothetical protein [Micromonospora sp. 4G55]|uniref:hypothetical protein n=1 Tax=Micromonospora sp. 4G55 TaxID=2806102 RepID=UPI001A4B19F3|nr:hypothetical protein [Micromonospora sp. 4G55]MBM0257378.1 hypothetical protein [Micromonospora sp. 4G55]